MTLWDAIEKVKYLNSRIPGWYQWATAAPITWEKVDQWIGLLKKAEGGKEGAGGKVQHLWRADKKASLP